MAQNEPNPAEAGASDFAPPKEGEVTPPAKDNSNPDKSGANPDENGESLEVINAQNEKLVEAWKEDREYFQNDIKRLRAEVKSPEYTREEEETLEELTGIERDRKVVEFHKKREKAAHDAELKQLNSEITFYERTDKEFAANKKDILKVAGDYDCPNLKQAILVWRGLNAGKVQKDKNYNDQRKKEADGKSGGNAGGSPAVKPYDSKSDSKKSFGDLYREAGVK